MVKKSHERAEQYIQTDTLKARHIVEPEILIAQNYHENH
jgi:hypothetical protein